MKKLSTYLFLLLFSFSVTSFADDISEFQIEGMSIGDSALDYFTEEQIQKNKMDYYKDKTFTPVQNDYLPFFETYDAVDFDYKTGDNNYIIHALSGVIIYEKNVEDCYKKQDEIVLELSKVFKDNAEQSKKDITKHPNDRSGKSKVTRVTFWFESGNYAGVHCYDYSKEHGSQDHLKVSFKTKEFNDFLGHAYK